MPSTCSARRVSGEHVFRVPPLPVPPADLAARAGWPVLSRCSCFAERAVLYRRGFALDAANAAAGLLSEREREIVALLAGGATDAQIAGRLFLSVNTVRSHLERIRDKTGARRRPDLVRYALQAGIGTVASSS